MTPAPPNLFTALFEFHPREGHTPKENFLTEALAYLLRTESEARDRWLSCLLGRTVEAASCEVVTRQSEKDDDSDSTVYPDLLLEGQLAGGEPFAVYCEHKWDSPCNPGQLVKYQKLVVRKGAHARLAFVGATHKQRAEARQCLRDDRCALWEDAFTVLDRVTDKSALLGEFLDFMKTHGLSPVPPITVDAMRAFLGASGFLDSLLNLANRLNDGYPWDAIPARFHAVNDVHHGYGRVCIRFGTEGWKPAVVVGFLYDEADHKVTFVNREKGIDLFLRIEAWPKDTKAIQPVLDVLAEKRKLVKASAASVLLKGERGNGNPWSVLIVRDCLADVLGGAAATDGQLTAIHARLVGWLRVLFGGGDLEGALKKCKLDSGMKK